MNKQYSVVSGFRRMEEAEAYVTANKNKNPNYRGFAKMDERDNVPVVVEES